VKPAPFAYARPDSLDDALAILAEHEEARPLAGGQSLVPAMNFRLAQPSMLVDLNSIRELTGVEQAGEGLTIGAMTRHRELERSALVAQLSPLVTETMPFIAHPPIRTRGTIGGSLAHADPAAELPAVMLALDATIGVRSGAGARTIPAAAFFVGLYATALSAGELVVNVSVPAMPTGAGWAFDEVARRHGDYALAGAAAVVVLDGNGLVRTARVALLSLHERPILALEAARTLVGERPTPDAIAAAAAAAADRDADPSSDIHASSDYRRHLAGVLVRRVLTRAVTRATAAG
jgi:aerobic carbon-monoxide dehydrogenase medium subunit